MTEPEAHHHAITPERGRDITYNPAPKGAFIFDAPDHVTVYAAKLPTWGLWGSENPVGVLALVEKRRDGRFGNWYWFAPCDCPPSGHTRAHVEVVFD